MKPYKPASYFRALLNVRQPRRPKAAQPHYVAAIPCMACLSSRLGWSNRRLAKWFSVSNRWARAVSSEVRSLPRLPQPLAVPVDGTDLHLRNSALALLGELRGKLDEEALWPDHTP